MGSNLCIRYTRARYVQGHVKQRSGLINVRERFLLYLRKGVAIFDQPLDPAHRVHDFENPSIDDVSEGLGLGLIFIRVRVRVREKRAIRLRAGAGARGCVGAERQKVRVVDRWQHIG